MKVLKAPNQLLTPEQIFEDASRYSPIYSSPKYDGNRGLCLAGQLLTSDMKEPRNERLWAWLEPVRKWCSEREMVLDYEIFSPSQTHHAETGGIINSYDMFLPEDLVCMVFDAAPVDKWYDQCEYLPYVDRIKLYTDAVTDIAFSPLRAVDQREVASAMVAAQLFEQDVAEGLEGSMLRTGHIWYEGRYIRGGFYKHGRATIPQCVIWKQKVYETADGYIIGVQQRRALRADWPRTYRGDGRLARPLEKDAYELTDSIGAFLVRVPKEDGTYVDTEIGFREGFDLEWRREWWSRYQQDNSTLLGRWVEFKHMPHGAKQEGRARAGGLVRFRDDLIRIIVEAPVEVTIPVRDLEPTAQEQ